MAKIRKSTETAARTTTETIRSRIEGGGERIWRFADFAGLPPEAMRRPFRGYRGRG
jgi:hypothetical protein